MMSIAGHAFGNGPPGPTWPRMARAAASVSGLAGIAGIGVRSWSGWVLARGLCVSAGGEEGDADADRFLYRLLPGLLLSSGPVACRGTDQHPRVAGRPAPPAARLRGRAALRLTWPDEPACPDRPAKSRLLAGV